MPPLEIGLRRRVLWRRIAWLVPLGLIWLVAGLALLAGALITEAPFLQDRAWLWPLGGVILLVGAYDARRVARLRGGALRLDEEGVTDRRIQRRPLPWEQIRRIEVRVDEGRPVLIGFWPKGRAGPYLARAPFWNYFGLIYLLMLLAAPYRFAPISVDLEPLDADPEAVIAAVEARCGPAARQAMTRRARA